MTSHAEGRPLLIFLHQRRSSGVILGLEPHFLKSSGLFILQPPSLAVGTECLRRTWHLARADSARDQSLYPPGAQLSPKETILTLKCLCPCHFKRCREERLTLPTDRERSERVWMSLWNVVTQTRRKQSHKWEERWERRC